MELKGNSISICIGTLLLFIVRLKQCNYNYSALPRLPVVKLKEIGLVKTILLLPPVLGGLLASGHVMDGS